MKGAGVILKRELASYFKSPLGYMFIIVFVLVLTGLFLSFPPFFSYPVADMSGFFGWLIPVLCVFIPAITMRVWAEERKENTIEMLCTFPMSTMALVVGKFMAALVFYLVALACTWVVPVMLEVLGEPDWGVIFSSYLGAVLLGGLFISLGVLVSGFCKDQVISFVFSFLVCSLLALVGWDVFVSILDGMVTFGKEGVGLGTLLKDMVGLTPHYLPFVRGVIDFSGLIYFVMWTCIFLFLNAAYLELRGRSAARWMYPVGVLLAVFMGVLVNQVAYALHLNTVRLDMTENKAYTVADATRQILRSLPSPVEVNVYITRPEKMPAALKSLQRDITNKLDEMKAVSGGKLRWKVIPMSAASVLKKAGEEKKSTEKSLEERLLDKGIRPFSVSTMQQDKAATFLIYSSIGVTYQDREEFIPRVMPGDVPQLEYKIMSIVAKISRDELPRIAMVAPTQEIKIPPYLMQLYMQMGKTPPTTEDPYLLVQRVLESEHFKVDRVELTQKSKLPNEYDALVVINPRELNKRQRWEINRALVEGKPTFMAVQMYRWDYSVGKDSISITRKDEKPGVNEFLEKNGVSVDTNILMDESHQPLSVVNSADPLSALLGGGVTVNLPMHILVVPENMNHEVSMTSGLGPLFYLWGTAVKLDEKKLTEKGIDVTVLFSTSPKAWTLPPDTQFTERDVTPPPDARSYPLAVMLKGQFVNAYPGDEIPAWPPEPRMGYVPPEEEGTEPAPELHPVPGKLILTGCAQMFTRNFLTESSMDFLLNCVDALTLGDKLVEIRAKKPIDRTMSVDSAFIRNLWKFLVLAGMNIIVAVLGVIRGVVTAASRQAYRRKVLAEVER